MTCLEGKGVLGTIHFMGDWKSIGYVSFAEKVIKQMGVFFFTCSNFGMYENDHITVHFTDVEFHTVKNNTFQHWKCKPKWIINLSLDSPELENSFWIIANPNKHFAWSPLRLFQFYQLRLFLSFLCLWTNRFAILLQYLSNLELDFFALLLPSPIMRIWNLNWIDLPPGREITVYLSRFTIHDQNSRDCRKDRKATRWKAQKRKKKPKLIELEKMQRAWGKVLVRVGYDPKRVFKFGGIKG